MYKDINDMLKTAKQLGIIELNKKQIKNADYNKFNVSIVVKDPLEWLKFLNDVVCKSDDTEEKKFAVFLVHNFEKFMLQQQEIDNDIFDKKSEMVQDELKNSLVETITEEDISELKETLDNAKTIDDFLEKL